MATTSSDSYLLPKDYVASPEAMAQRYTPAEAQAYTDWLAHVHYENFHVVSVLLPKHLHQDFYNVYGFCRWADDLGDEIGDPVESLRLLAWWRESLARMYAGDATHPVFVALAQTVQRYEIPQEPFDDLITAFVQDQTVTSYATFADLYEYCRYSANPVGRLVLYLCGYRDAERQRLSDFTCTALQLANFWQDVSVDLQKDRIYVPLEAIERHGYTTAELRAGLESDAFRAVMRECVAEARRLFHLGLPLVDSVDRRLAVDLDLFSRGGLYILDKIERQEYNVLLQRPHISKVERIGILLRALLRAPFRKAVATA